MANVQSIYELRAIRQAELDNQLREQKQTYPVTAAGVTKATS
jgi:hypothetical protein